MFCVFFKESWKALIDGDGAYVHVHLRVKNSEGCFFGFGLVDTNAFSSLQRPKLSDASSLLIILGNTRCYGL